MWVDDGVPARASALPTEELFVYVYVLAHDMVLTGWCSGDRARAREASAGLRLYYCHSTVIV
jgi:hypothetical protein